MRKKIYKLIRENNGLMKKGNNIVAQYYTFWNFFCEHCSHIIYIKINNFY